jgi:hypothetical protein
VASCSLGLPQGIATGLGQQVHKGDTLVIAHASSPEAATQAHQALEAHHPRAETDSASGVVAVPPAGG